MRLRRLLLLAAGSSLAFTLGYGVIANAWPMPGFTRDPNYGYFLNDYDAWGTSVWPDNSTTSGCAASGGNALPTSINNATELIDFVTCKLNSGNGNLTHRNAERTGAAFIIQTMIGTGTSRPPTAAQKSKWEADVRFSEQMGWINWSATYSYTTNTYWQGTGSGSNWNDDAFFHDNGSGAAITFRNASGTIIYAIRKQCANPVGTGSFAPIPDSPDFDMSGDTAVDNNSPVPGQTINFAHALTSNNPTSPATIGWTTQNTRNGNSTVASGNAGTFGDGQTKPVGPESYLVPLGTPAGTEICRRVIWTPDTDSGGSQPSVEECAIVAGNFDLNPAINVQINGGTVTGNFAEPGDTITFNYAVNNTANGASSNTACNIYGLSRDGHYTIPNPIDNTSDAGYAPPPGVPGCPRNFAGSSSTALGAENVTAVANKSFCRSLFVNPATPGGGALGTEVCAYIVSKPYVRIYGGDAAAGGGLATAPGVCSQNSGAAIIGWNKRGAEYAGAGLQFAAYAMSTIFDTATSLGNGGSAPPPTRLSFANTVTNAANGDFGGSLGSIDCIPDHYATMPGSTSAIQSDIDLMGSGSYSGVGDFVLRGGTIDTGERISIYVDGNLFIRDNITYAGSWNSGNMPMFRLVVKGNIFIDNDVSQVDGLYVAQPDGGTDGVIHTCAQSSAPFTPMVLDSALITQCAITKLTINGSFVAKQVRLLRTIGTLRQAAAAEGSGAGNMAEAFNFSPMLWMTQPSATSGSAEYDAINSLPPIL